MKTGSTSNRPQRGALAAVACAALLSLATAHPALSAVVGFSQTSGISACDDTISVDVVVDASAVDLRGFSFVLEFDPAIVTPVTVGPGALVLSAACPNFNSWLNQAAIGDSIEVDGALLGCSVAGPGAFLTVRFVGVSPGVSTIDCRSAMMRDSQNQAIAVTCTPGTIEYTCPTAVEPFNWGRIKLLFR